MAVRIASALVSGGSYTYEDAQRTNAGEGWTYRRTAGQGRDGGRVETMRLSGEQLSLAWLTANRRVDNDPERSV